MNRLPVPPLWQSTLCIITNASEHDREVYLTAEEQERARTFPRPKRQAEWTASRIAVKLLAIDRRLCSEPRDCSVVSSYRKPSLHLRGALSVFHVSISHSEGAGAAGIDDHPIGIDIQKIRPLNPRAMKFYLKDDERAALERTSISDRLIHFWCAKEAAFKLKAGRGWLKRVSIELKKETGEGLAFELSYPVRGTVDTFRVDADYIAAVARQL